MFIVPRSLHQAVMNTLRNGSGLKVIILSNVQFLAQDNHFASYDLNVSSGPPGINNGLPRFIFLTLKVSLTSTL